MEVQDPRKCWHRLPSTAVLTHCTFRRCFWPTAAYSKWKTDNFFFCIEFKTATKNINIFSYNSSLLNFIERLRYIDMRWKPISFTNTRVLKKPNKNSEWNQKKYVQMVQHDSVINWLRNGHTKVTHKYLTFKEESPTCITRRA